MISEQSGRITALGLLVTLMVTMVLAGALSSSSVRAATLSGVDDTMNNATPLSSSSHVLDFTTYTEIPVGGHIVIEFDVSGTAFNLSSVDSADVSNPFGGSASVSVNTTTDVIRIENTNAPLAAGAVNDLTVQDVLNPSGVDSYQIGITTDDGAAVLDSGSTWVAINDYVWLSANVESYFDFVITGETTNATIDTLAYETDTSVTACAFGTVQPDTEYTCAQHLHARTNAASGFVVTVEQNHDMLASSGADIDAFIDGTPSAGAAWVSPSATNGSENTYGHLGFYSSDNAAAGIASANFFGLNGTTQKTVFSHPSPVTGGTQWSGTDVDGANTATMLYRLEISDLQEPGYYQSRLMYIGTATF